MPWFCRRPVYFGKFIICTKELLMNINSFHYFCLCHEPKIQLTGFESRMHRAKNSITPISICTQSFVSWDMTLMALPGYHQPWCWHSRATLLQLCRLINIAELHILQVLCFTKHAINSSKRLPFVNSTCIFYIIKDFHSDMLSREYRAVGNRYPRPNRLTRDKKSVFTVTHALICICCMEI